MAGTMLRIASAARVARLVGDRQSVVSHQMHGERSAGALGGLGACFQRASDTDWEILAITPFRFRGPRRSSGAGIVGRII